MFIREKKTICGRYTEIDIIPRTEKAEIATRGKRGKKKKATPPKQNNLNEKNAKRYLVQLANGNFTKGDLHVSLTYNKEHLPDTVEEAERIVSNYLRRIAYRRNKLGLEPLKYILVTEYKYGKGGEQITRLHHHIIMNGEMNRDEVEAMWTAKRINWKKYNNDREYRNSIEQIGWVNADRLQVNENGIEALCKYIVKTPQGKKRYSSSRNLKRPEVQKNDSMEQQSNRYNRKNSRNLQVPVEKCNDYKYSRKKVKRLAESPDAGMEEFKRIYSRYDIVSVETVYYEKTGWHIYLKMWKKPPDKPKPKGRKKRE